MMEHDTAHIEVEHKLEAPHSRPDIDYQRLLILSSRQIGITQFQDLWSNVSHTAAIGVEHKLEAPFKTRYRLSKIAHPSSSHIGILTNLKIYRQMPNCYEASDT